MDTRQQRKRMSSENRGQTGLGYVELRLRKTIVNPTVSTDDWYTPQWIIDTLRPFDLDPCAPPAEVRPYEIAPTAYTTGSPFFGSCLVAWGDGCDRRLRGSGIEGKYVVLNM